MLVGPKNAFGPDPNPKNSPEGPKKAKKAQNEAKLKLKRYVYTSKTKSSKNVIEPDSNSKLSPKDPNNTPKGPKKLKKEAQNVAKFKTKS